MISRSSPSSLKPHDVCVALQFALSPNTTFRELAENVGLSLGEAHNATQRIEAARLILPDRGPVNKQGLLEFLFSGVPYSFPAALGPETRGVPTAHSGPVLRGVADSLEQVVWPSVRGNVRGLSVEPLCKGAPEMPEKNPRLYAWLTVVDALRVGRARDRHMAQEYLQEELLGHAGQ